MWYFGLEHTFSRLLQILKEQQDHSFPPLQWTLIFKSKLNRFNSSPCLKRTTKSVCWYIYIYIKPVFFCFNLNLFIFRKEHPKLILLRNRINNVLSVLDTWTLPDSTLIYMFNKQKNAHWTMVKQRLGLNNSLLNLNYKSNGKLSYGP